MAINNEDELEAALKRAQDLLGFAAGSAEEHELVEIENQLPALCFTSMGYGASSER